MALRQRTDRWRRAMSLIPGGVNSPVRAMRAVVLETLTAIRRAGADIVITYHAKDAARWLQT